MTQILVTWTAQAAYTLFHPLRKHPRTRENIILEENWAPCLEITRHRSSCLWEITSGIRSEWRSNSLIHGIVSNYSPKWRWIVVDIYRAARRWGVRTLLITSKLANQRAWKVLFTCVVYNKTEYSLFHLRKLKPIFWMSFFLKTSATLRGDERTPRSTQDKKVIFWTNRLRESSERSRGWRNRKDQSKLKNKQSNQLPCR